MDTKSGEWVDDGLAEKLKKERPADLERFAYGQRVQIGTAHFEVCKIDTQRNRLVLKAIPRPIDDGEKSLTRRATLASYTLGPSSRP